MFKKVVIIDDNQTQLKILSSFFRDNGWEVFDVCNIQDAIKIIYLNSPDVVITDAIMPKEGGFQLLTYLRENKALRKIPVIVYSILTSGVENLYIKNKKNEYFLTKSEDLDEILNLANKATEENPLSTQDKIDIFNNRTPFPEKKSEAIPEIENIINEYKFEHKKEKYVFNIEENKLLTLFKRNYLSLNNDKTLSKELFLILYSLLGYDLSVVCFYDYENKQRVLNFDIKNFILSPILQNYFSSKYNCNNISLNKKYIPNSKTISSIKEFNSKIEFDFVYKDESTANIAFYSRKEKLWENEASNKILKQILDDFFKIRFINKKSQNTTEETISDKYLEDKMSFNLKNKFNPTKTKIGLYVGVVNFVNYSDLEAKYDQQALDLLNLKISENIMNCMVQGEQIEKTEEDEYVLSLLAENDTEAQKKFNMIFNTLKNTSMEELKPEITIGVSNCYINGVFDFNLAQKQARLALEKITDKNRVVIYAEQ